MKPFLSIKEASEYLGLEYKTVYRLVRAGEIPAARLGGVYRIKLMDLEEYFEQQKQRVLARNGAKQDALLSSPALAHCGRCLRVIHREDQIAGTCATPGCGTTLCQSCWTEDGARYCLRHEPSREDKLRRALQDHAAGLIPRSVTAEQARQMELSYIGRFDRKIRQLESIREPVAGRAIPVQDWDAIHESRDDVARLKQIVARDALSDVDESRMPLNSSSIYRVAEASGKLAGLVITASCCVHLESLARDGVDTAPVRLSELLDLLQTSIQVAEKSKSIYVCAFASPTGWTTEAVEYIGGGERHRVFQHRLVLPFLVDLSDGKVYHDRLDERLTEFESLFSARLRHEQVEEARSYAERYLLSERRSLSAPDAASVLKLPLDVVIDAFARLGKDERFKVWNVPGSGQVVALRD